MAEKKILPNSVLLTAEVTGDSGQEKTVVCLMQNDQNSTANIITADTFCGTEKLSGSKGMTLNVTFRRIWTPDSTHISEAFFYDAWLNDTNLTFTVGPANPVTGDIVYTGTGLVSSYNNQNGTNAVPQATMTIECDAPMTRTTH